MGKTIKVEAYLSIGYSGANHKEIIEVEIDDEFTEEQREDAICSDVQEWANNFIEINWKEL